MYPTSLSRVIGGAGILAITSGGVMGSKPALIIGSILLLAIFSRGIIFLKKEKTIAEKISCERSFNNLIVRQYGRLSAFLSVTGDLPEGLNIAIRDLPGAGFEEIGEAPVLDLKSGSSIRYHLRPITRGKILYDGFVLSLSDNYFTTDIYFRRPEDRLPEIWVQPLGFPVVVAEKAGGYGDATSHRYLSPTGTIIRSFRDYMPGDDTRMIDWKITAKKKRLTVREAYAQRGDIPIIVIDLPLDKTENEILIKSATGITEELLRQAQSLSLLVVSGPNILLYLPNERRVSRVLAGIRDLPAPVQITHLYRYASVSDLIMEKNRLPPLERWFRAVIESRGMVSFEVDCIRAFSNTKGHSLLLFSACSGDTSHVGMIARAARHLGLPVHLHIPSFCQVNTTICTYPLDSIEVIK